MDLRERALDLAGAVLNLAQANHGHGRDMARDILGSGAAEAKFLAICEAQGGFREPQIEPHHAFETAAMGGNVMTNDHRRIPNIATNGKPSVRERGVTYGEIMGVERHIKK